MTSLPPADAPAPASRFRDGLVAALPLVPGVTAFGLVDESYALTISRYLQGKGSREFFLAVNLKMGDALKYFNNYSHSNMDTPVQTYLLI